MKLTTLLLSTVALTLSASAFAGAPFEIEPFASLPYVKQQISAQVPVPQLLSLSTSALREGEPPCAAYAWNYTFVAAPVPTPHGEPSVSKIGTVRLALTLQSGRCVWTSEVAGLGDGVPYGGTVESFFDAGQLISVDSAIAAAQQAAGSDLLVGSIFLSGPSDAVDTRLTPGPHYAIVGTTKGQSWSYQINALTGHVDIASQIVVN